MAQARHTTGFLRSMANLGLLAFLTILGAAQTPPPVLTTLYTFTGLNGDGFAATGVTLSGNGILYGTTSGGGIPNSCGPSGCGTVFALSPPAAPGGVWSESVLYSFTNHPSDGTVPSGGVVIGKGGTLYGTTYAGGASGCCGTVFELTPPAAAGGTWTEYILHNFGGRGDGSMPSGVVRGRGGVLYGTTPYSRGTGLGTAYALTPPTAAGGKWMETILHLFTGEHGDGAMPFGTLAIGANGALYGTTFNGGVYSSGLTGPGTVYELMPPATPGGAWTETVLYNFTGGNDGAYPDAGVLLDANGEVYGTTEYGGSAGSGVVFQLTPPSVPGGAWTESVLYSFCSAFDCADGSAPYISVIGADGSIYGTTGRGGTSNEGTIFKLTPPAAGGQNWTYTVLYNFTLVNGAYPGGLVQGKGGGLYGTTAVGWTGPGTVFELTP